MVDTQGSHPKVKANGEILARANVARRRVVIRLVGQVTPDVLLGANLAIRAEMGKLEQPYDCITDVTELSPMSEDAAHLFRELIRSFVKEVQIRHYVRVVGRAAMATAQLERASREAGYEAHLAFSLDEAERMLDELAQRDAGVKKL